MESANVNDDSQFDTLLQRHDSTPLPDDGFSARVLAALPAPARQRARVRWHGWVIAGIAAAWFVIWGQGLIDSHATNGTAALLGSVDWLIDLATQPEMLIVLGGTALALALTNPENLPE